ncbi:FAST kinase domain-containing protein 2, mitochondrial [Centroberyx affinis]|uniref:FAST kinase domain-containing protein 2, mitochondrial n=1 Tax=Centroberyx affinis TaxID=166261 RepID=UPI003A5C3A5A
MSVWVTEEVMRRALRFSCRRSLWQPRGLQVMTSVRDASSPDQPLSHIWSTRQSQTLLAGNLVSPVRYYFQGKIHTEGLEEKGRLSAQPSQSSFPTKIQPTETVSEQTLKRIPFYNKLEGCGSPTDVLDLTTQYLPTNLQISNCLMHMWGTTKKMSEEQLRYELQLMFEHPEFDKLLQMAMKGAGNMRSKDLTYSLLAMVKLGVPQRSLVVQVFLRTCQEKMNKFDEKCLSILASCLDHMDSSPNVNALKEGMRLIVDARLPSIKNVMALQTMMRLVGKDAPLVLKKKLERKALSMTDQFSLPNSQHMISIMATMGFYSKPLLDICSKKITENIHGIPFNRIFMVLRACKELLYRDLDLLTTISDNIASTMDIWSTKQVVLFLSVFEQLAFCPTALMEAFAGRAMANSDTLTLWELLCVLKAYSFLNYDLQDHRQQFLDNLSQALDSYLSKMSAPAVLKAVYCLCLLGHFPAAPLEHLLQSSILEQLSPTIPKLLRSQERMFQTVDLCLRLDRPPLPRPLTVPPSVLGDPAPCNRSVHPRLSRALQDALGDGADGTLQEAVVVENFYLTDGVITKPLPVTKGSSPAGEESSPAESSQRIAVICVPQSAFCYGTSHPRGLLAVKIRHLKILGYTPVLVTEQELESVSEEERVAVLRRRIFPEHQGADAEPKTD